MDVDVLSNVFELSASVPDSAELSTKEIPTGTKNISANGTYDVTAYASASVSVPEPTGTVSIIANGTHDVTDYASAIVSVPEPSGTITLVKNNYTYNVKNYANATTDIPLEEKTVTPSTSQQVITAGTGYEGISQVTVEAIPEPLERKAVNFYDYDGTLLYAYTAQEAAALTALPDTQTHDNLVADGWTHTLQQIQTAVSNGYEVDVGAQYTTVGGKTRLYLSGVTADDLSDWELCLKIKNGTVTATCNGTTLDTETESANSEVNHTLTFSLPSAESYPADYVIELSFEGSGYYLLGQNPMRSRVFGWNTSHNQLLTKVETDSLCRISNYVFNCCFSLNSIVISSGVTSIGTGTFYGCASLNSIVIPSGVTSIGSGAFQYCSSLNSIVIPSDVTSIGTYAFQYCSSLNDIVIPSGVTSIATSAFYACNSLNDIVIPSDVTSIGTYAFYACNSLNDIVIPSGVTSIGSNVFQYCGSLNSVVIPNSVTSIGAQAFQYCSLLLIIDLSELTNPNSIPTLADTNALGNTPSDQIIYVANQEMLTAFSSATNWSTYASRFQIKP